MKSFIIVLTFAALVYGQEESNQLSNGQQFEQQQQQQQQQQMFDQNQEQNSRSAEENPIQKSAPQHPQTVQAFVLSSNGHHQQIQHLPHHQQQEILKIVASQQPQQEKIVLSLNQPQLLNEKFVIAQQQPQQEKIVLQLGQPLQEKIVLQAQPLQLPQLQLPEQQQIIKVVEVEEKKPVKEVVHHNSQPVCHLLGRKGECISIPNYFGCIRNGGILFMSFSECGFNTGFGCCVKNIVPFLSQSK